MTHDGSREDGNGAGRPKVGVVKTIARLSSKEVDGGSSLTLLPN